MTLVTLWEDLAENAIMLGKGEVKEEKKQDPKGSHSLSKDVNDRMF